MTLIIKKPTGAKLVMSKIQQYPAVLGEPWGGGYFAGYISHTANGNPTHALIVAPRATGATGTGYPVTTNLAWKTTDTNTSGTNGVFNGVANTASIVAAGIADHPAAQFCTQLSIGGFTDWYLPALFELNIAYFNLKPAINANGVNTGANIYAVPQRSSDWSADYPGQTYLDLFKAGGSEAFSTLLNHATSRTSTPTNYSTISFLTGVLSNLSKTQVSAVRAFRRIALP